MYNGFNQGSERGGSLTKIAVVFPGGGLARAGVGRSLYESFPEVREMVDLTSQVVVSRGGTDLVSLLEEGTDEELNQAEKIHPLIFSESVGVAFHFIPVLKAAGIEVVVSGFSLGDYSAATVAGVLERKRAAEIVFQRAKLLGEVKDGAMALVNSAADRVKEVCRGINFSVASYNSPYSINIAGPETQISEAIARLKIAKIAALRLRGPMSHTPLLEEQARNLAGYFNNTRFRPPSLPIVTTTAVKVQEFGRGVREHLKAQLTSPINLEKAVQLLWEMGVRHFIEPGLTSSISDYIQQTCADSKVHPITDKVSMEKVIDLLLS